MVRIVSLLLVSLGMLMSGPIFAQGDAQAGKQKSALCASCHGVDGNSTIPQNPKLAGQVPGYITKQLQDFKSGERKSAIMAGFAGSLSDQDMADFDAYFSSQTTSSGSIAKDQVETAMMAESIFRGGIAKFNVPACMGCHGPAGAGIAPNFPKLAGQHADYIESQLLAFKSGSRENAIMGPIAFSLSEEQIKQLALYISALQ